MVVVLWENVLPKLTVWYQSKLPQQNDGTEKTRARYVLLTAERALATRGICSDRVIDVFKSY